uniref:histidine kinase n=1 Tax=Melanopsichium pennsylvanicum 4 TaxID=1398559 RepID=A0A077RDE4_9BASI|nr:two-component sensor molecule [Melanopsichium pennsylvanicum 4]
MELSGSTPPSGSSAAPLSQSRLHPDGAAAHVSSGSSSSQSVHTSSVDSIPIGGQTATPSSSTSPQLKSTKMRMPASDFDDASSFDSNDALAAARVHIKSGISSPRSSVSSSGAVRRGAWRGMGAASASASRSFTHGYRGETYASSSSSEVGADETSSAASVAHAPDNLAPTAASPSNRGSSISGGSVESEDEDKYEENPQQLNVSDHPAWYKLRSQPGVAAPGALSYLPSVAPKGSTSSFEPSTSTSDTQQHINRCKQAPEFSHPFQAASSSILEVAGLANGDTACASAIPTNKGAPPAADGDPSLQSIEAGAYDWANFVYAYARGRWNPGLIPQPPGQSTAFPGAKVRITISESSGDEHATAPGVANRRRPSLEYFMPRSEQGTAAHATLSIAAELEPHSLPLSARGSTDAHPENGDSNTVASLPLDVEAGSFNFDGYEDKTPLRPHTMEYISSPKKASVQLSNDEPSTSRVDGTRSTAAASNDIDANILTALREPSASMSAVSRLSTSVGKKMLARGLHGNAVEETPDRPEEAHSPQRAKTVPEGIPLRGSRKELPSQADRMALAPAQQLAPPPQHNSRRQHSDSILEEAREAVAPANRILSDDPFKPVFGTPAKAIADPMQSSTPLKQKSPAHFGVEGISPMSTPQADTTPSTRAKSKLADSVLRESGTPTAGRGESPEHKEDLELEGLNRPGPTPIQSTHGGPKQPVVWQSAPEGFSSFAEAMSRQASGAAAAEPKGANFNEITFDNVTVAGLRRAARRTSMERSERADVERSRIDGGRDSKCSLVSHSASFPGSSPRPSISAAGGPREGVQALSHLSMGGGSSSSASASASASTNKGPTVSVAHFVGGKHSGETRIDLRGTVTTSPASAPKDVSDGASGGATPYDVSARDVSLAANATARPRPLMTTTSSQRIQSYLAAGKRTELFYRDHGYLPSIVPPHEGSRLHALSRYGPPKIAGNPNFERIAHLVKLVFNSKLVLITLVGENEQIFQTQMGGGGEITIATLQTLAGSRNCSFCSHAILQDSDEPIVIFDAVKDWRFSGSPLVQGSPDIRFYAGSPLRTSDGLNIGSLCLIDDKPRSEFGPRQRHTLKEFARVVMREMELLRDKIQFGMRDRMQRSVELFTKECLEMDSEEGESEAVATPQGTIGTHKVFQLAAQSMREAMQASGAVIFDLSHFELIDSYESDFVPSELGTGTSSKIYFANPLSSQETASEPASGLGSEVGGTSFAAAGESITPHSKGGARGHKFDGTTGFETFRSPFNSPMGEQSARAKRVPPMNVLGASEADGVPPERSEFVPLSHHVRMAEFLRIHRTGKFYSYAPPPFRSLLPPGVTGLLLVPIFGLNKQPFALLCAYITSSERTIALEELQVSGMQYLRALGMIVLSAILKKDIMLADKAKSNFISNISHELRTPLHGILAAAELLAETKLNATQGSYLETVEACGKSLLELVNHVLDFTKLSGNTRQGKRSVQTKTKCDMVKLIQEVCESSWIGQMARQVENASSGIGSVYAPPDSSAGGGGGSMVQARAKAARENKVETVIDIALREDGWLVNCDTGGIRRVLMNLIGNSLKFTQAGFVHVSLREVQSSTTHIMIELSVTDTGRGISRTFLEDQLFHPFTQENPHGTGTGLGLSIVNSIVQSPSLNGKIDVWSTEGEGTEIRITCELELCEDDDVEGPTYKPTVNVHQGYSVALLGFDESRGDLDLRLALQGYFLNWWEFKLSECTKLDDHVKHSDVLVVNDDMKLLEKVKKERKGDLPPVIFLTSCRGDSDIAMACEDYHAAGGVARILFKPAGPAKLEGVVDFCLQCLERKRSGDPPSTEETKPSTPLPSPGEAGSAQKVMEQGGSYFAPRHSRPDINTHPGHELGSFESNASITPRAEGSTPGPVAQDMAAEASSKLGQLAATREQAVPAAAGCQIRDLRRPTLETIVDRTRSYHMSPEPPGSASNSLIRRHSTEARMDSGNENATASKSPKPSRPLLPARSITYHEPRLHKHVHMSPLAGNSPRDGVDGDGYFERVPTPSTSHTPNTPGSTISLEGGDGAVLKSAVAPSRNSGGSLLGVGGSGANRKRMQILSVEDNAINRKVIAAFLAKLDVDFVEATNGEEGINAFKRYPPNHFDVVLMDLSMPVLDGISAIAAIRKIEMESGRKADGGNSGGVVKLPARNRSKIFALTGRSTDEDKRQAFLTGADGYIVKPLSFKVLSSLLRMLMR